MLEFVHFCKDESLGSGASLCHKTNRINGNIGLDYGIIYKFTKELSKCWPRQRDSC